MDPVMGQSFTTADITFASYALTTFGIVTISSTSGMLTGWYQTFTYPS